MGPAIFLMSRDGDQYAVTCGDQPHGKFESRAEAIKNAIFLADRNVHGGCPSIVVAKEEDGRFRMAWIPGDPLPTEIERQTHASPGARDGPPGDQPGLALS